MKYWSQSPPDNEASVLQWSTSTCLYFNTVWMRTDGDTSAGQTDNVGLIKSKGRGFASPGGVSRILPPHWPAGGRRRGSRVHRNKSRRGRTPARVLVLFPANHDEHGKRPPAVPRSPAPRHSSRGPRLEGTSACGLWFTGKRCCLKAAASRIKSTPYAGAPSAPFLNISWILKYLEYIVWLKKFECVSSRLIH